MDKIDAVQGARRTAEEFNTQQRRASQRRRNALTLAFSKHPLNVR